MKEKKFQKGTGKKVKTKKIAQKQKPFLPVI